MGLRGLGRAAALMVVAALASACGGQTGIGSGASQGLPTASRGHRESGSGGDLVYLMTAKGIVILTYPNWSIVATIPGYRTWYFVCADPHNGNVFALAPDKEEIDEYAHGGTTPIATLTVPAGYEDLGGCSIDPTTGNLALLAADSRLHSAVLVYPPGEGTPTVYSDKKLGLSALAYDNAGNLFATAEDRNRFARIAELKAGHTEFTTIKSDVNEYPRHVQWDGRYLVFQTANGRGGGSTVYQLVINGKTATLVKTIHLNNCNDENFWIDGSSLISVYYPPKRANYRQGIATWNYPAGGNPTSQFYSIAKGRDDYTYEMAVSVAPSH